MNARLRSAVLVVACGIALMAFPAFAHAATWMSEYPAGTIHTQPTLVGVDVFGATALNPKTVVMTVGGVARKASVTQGPASGHWNLSEVLVNGVWKATWTWVPDTGGATKSTVSCNPGGLGDGATTVTVAATDASGTVLNHSWTFIVNAPPTFGGPVPIAGSRAKTPTPMISIPVSDNTAVTSASATVNGSPSTATLGGGRITVSGFTLAADGPVAVVVTAGDAAGNTATKSWTFALSYYDNLTCHAVACHGTTYDADNAMGPDCVACHPGISHSAAHAASPGPQLITISNVSFGIHACTECHLPMNLMDLHGNACATCHPTPRGSLGFTWAKGCVQGGCHTSGSAAPMHASIDASHAIPADKAACLAAGCHDAGAITPFAGKSVALIHSNASTTTAGTTRASCQICHAAGMTPTADCTSSGCHPDRAAAHGYAPAKHLSNETCLLTCHQAELKPEHDSLTTPVACAGCHPTKVSQVSPWDKTCAACHPVIAHASADHSGTDAAVRASRPRNSGCSDTSPDQTNCHDISNVSALHFSMPAKGCAICHGPGKTPTRECRTCHPQNDPPTSQSYVATYYPAADGPVVGTTVASSGSTLWDKVDEPNPGDADSTYFQFTTPGSAMFTTTHAIPSTATITSVVVYARARTGSSTTRAYYSMVTVGGTTYQAAATNIGSTYTGGLGVAYSLTTNPKTGTAWTPADLNSTGGATTLDYFGVGTSNASTTGTGYLRVTQCSVVVNYSLAIAIPPGTLRSTSWYHHNNVKYLWDPSDASPGAFYYPDDNPAHGWNDALTYQDCFDFCHHDSAVGPPNFTAYQGQWMWYTTAGAYFPETRTLTLAPITVPATTPKLEFMTDYQLTGTDAGYVEVSTNGGTSYVPLTGTVGGVSKSSITGSAAGWVPASYDLSAYAGQVVKIRFRFVVNDGAIGWAFDNLTISGSGGTVFSDDAETLKPDWTDYHWTRSKGAYPFI